MGFDAAVVGGADEDGEGAELVEGEGSVWLVEGGTEVKEPDDSEKGEDAAWTESKLAATRRNTEEENGRKTILLQLIDIGTELPCLIDSAILQFQASI